MSFLAGLVVGITHEDVVPLFLMIFPLQIRGKSFNLVVFGGVQGEAALEVDFRLLLIQ
jgi:hypothetical protein